MAIALALSSAARVLAAQQTTVVRGRATSADSLPIANVTVTVTGASGAASVGRTDRRGRFAIGVAAMDDSYELSFVALGFVPRRIAVRRSAEDAEIVADVRLERAPQPLDALKVTAPRDRPAGNDADAAGGRNPERGFLAPDDYGDLAALASTIPGVQLVPSEDGGPAAFSVFGLAPEQNVTTLNGLRYAGFMMPRDAGVTMRLASSPYDVSRGGFSGAQLALSTRPGTNATVRRASFLLASPRLQFRPSSGGAPIPGASTLSASGAAAGPIVRDRAFYDVAWQLSRRSTALQTLLNTGANGLRSVGIAPDSMAALLDVLGRAGVPATVSAVPGSRENDQASVLASFDFRRPASGTGEAANLVLTGGWLRNDPAGLGTTELPAHAGRRTVWSGALQASHSAYWNGLLSEAALGVSRGRNYGTAYTALPNAVVQVSSAFSDGSTVVRPLAFGGNAGFAGGLTTTSMSFSHHLSWFSDDDRHRVKLGTDLRRDDFNQDQSGNLLGTFTYASLADLRANHPSSFTRQLSSRVIDGAQLGAGLSLGDEFRAADRLQLEYGMRLDANDFLFSPGDNALVEHAFGVRNDALPRRAYLSPRVGFVWSYAARGDRVRAVPGGQPSVRGGIGVFQSTPDAVVAAAAVSNTGLPTGVQQLSCVGTATPVPNWSSYLADSPGIPTQCANGAGAKAFSSASPNVTLFDPAFDAPRSVRSTLQWRGPLFGDRYAAEAEGVYSLNVDQPGFVDLNFLPQSRFVLADEGNRPVYAQAVNIVPATGVISARDARVSTAFSRVTELRSDLRSISRQLILRVTPARSSVHARWSLAYVYSNVRELSHGFASTAGDPQRDQWSRANSDARHQVLYSVSAGVAGVMQVSWFGTLRSGLPFTPMVAGDINGDGYANDRAFIFDPAHAHDASVAASMRQLLLRGPGDARTCLASELGRIAARNSCQGPWTSTAAMTVVPDVRRLHLPDRGNVSLSVGNPLAAADLLLHGENRLHGWGQNGYPDQSLLFIRGFDATARRFHYAVNEHFGESGAGRSVLRAPITLTAMFRVDLGPRRGIDDRVMPLRRRDVPDPIAELLGFADSLELTRMQVDTLAKLDSWYSVLVDSIWSQARGNTSPAATGVLTPAVSARPGTPAVVEARTETLALLEQIAPAIRALLTDDQLRRVPRQTARMLDSHYVAALRGGPTSSR